MSFSTLLILLALMVQQAASVAGLSWIAWHFERRQDIDAFHLMVPLAGGVLVVHWFEAVARVPLWGAALAGISVAALLDSGPSFSKAFRRRIAPDGLLLVGILGAAVSGSLFAFLTEHQPVAVPESRMAPLSLFSLAVLVSLLGVGSSRRSRYFRETTLGVGGREIAQGWRSLAEKPSAWFLVTYSLAWAAALVLPLTTTGVTSSRLLRDVVVALLVTRLVGPRKPWLLPVMAMLVASVRVAVAYHAAGAWAQSLAEAGLVAAALAISTSSQLIRRWSEIRV